MIQIANIDKDIPAGYILSELNKGHIQSLDDIDHKIVGDISTNISLRLDSSLFYCSGDIDVPRGKI